MQQDIPDHEMPGREDEEMPDRGKAPREMPSIDEDPTELPQEHPPEQPGSPSRRLIPTRWNGRTTCAVGRQRLAKSAAARPRVALAARHADRAGTSRSGIFL